MLRTIQTTLLPLFCAFTCVMSGCVNDSGDAQCQAGCLHTLTLEPTGEGDLPRVGEVAFSASRVVAFDCTDESAQAVSAPEDVLVECGQRSVSLLFSDAIFPNSVEVTLFDAAGEPITSGDFDVTWRGDRSVCEATCQDASLSLELEETM